MNDSLYENIKNIPRKSHFFTYLFIIIGAYCLYCLPIFNQPALIIAKGTICNVLLFIFALTLTSNETHPYFKLSHSLVYTIYLSFLLIILTTIIQTTLIGFFAVNDPQDLNRFIYDFSTPYFINQVIKYMFVGIGEEIFKLFIFFILYWTLQIITYQKYKLFSCLLSILSTSIIFGLLHVNYQPQNWFYISLPIAIGAFINFLFLFKFSSIIPLMISHAIKDILVFILLMNNHGLIIYIKLFRFIIVTTIILSTYYAVKYISSKYHIKKGRTS